MKKKFNIYAIVYKEVVIYVGITKTTINKRFAAPHPFIPKEIKAQSYPLLLEETDDAADERIWIKLFRSLNYPLYNIRNGNGLDYTDYNKEHQRKNYKQYYENYYKEYWSEYHKTDKYRSYMRRYMANYKKKKREISE